MRSREKHWREEQGGVARRSEKELRLSLSAAVTWKTQDVKPACASELLRRGPWRSHQIWGLSRAGYRGEQAAEVASWESARRGN